MLSLFKEARALGGDGEQKAAINKFELAAIIGKELLYNSYLQESEFEEQKNEAALNERRSSLKLQVQYSVERVSNKSANNSSPGNSVGNLSSSSD